MKQIKHTKFIEYYAKGLTLKNFFAASFNYLLNCEGLSDYENTCIENNNNTTKDALIAGFTWSETEEGHSYWSALYHNLKQTP